MSSKFSDKLANLKAQASSELSEAASGTSPARRPLDRSRSRNNSSAPKKAAHDTPPPYVFNFNDIPNITSDLQGIKSLEASLVASRGLPGQDRPTSPCKTARESPATWNEHTLTQPKGPGEEYLNLDQDRVRETFTRTSFLGIRSLPDALGPNFRQALYEDVLDLARRQTECQRMTGETRRSAAMAELSSGAANTQCSWDVASGQRRAGRLSALPAEMTGAFSTYLHMHTPFAAEEDEEKRETLESKALRIHKEDFLVRSIERPTNAKGVFSNPRYTEDPYENKEDMMRATLQGTIGKHKELQSVPWVAPGTAGACMNLKGRMPECIDALSRFFSENWPMSFRRLFEDASGCVVVVFDYHQAEQEGDMTSFMNHTAKTHAAAVEFQLAKDSTRWGVMEGTEPHVYFVFWPPWTRHRARVPDHLTGPAPRPTKLMWESSPPLPVHRVPHVLGNANCLFDQGYQKRVSEQTFR